LETSEFLNHIYANPIIENETKDSFEMFLTGDNQKYDVRKIKIDGFELVTMTEYKGNIYLDCFFKCKDKYYNSSIAYFPHGNRIDTELYELKNNIMIDVKEQGKIEKLGKYQKTSLEYFLNKTTFRLDFLMKSVKVNGKIMTKKS
jgi:hypothetical protein